jgi:hypothetical protein
MKLSSKISIALLALGIVTSASADNVVYLTGSTAFRSIVFNALNDNLGDTGAVFDVGTVTRATRGNATPSKCGYMLFHGNINSTPTYIDCAWSGSEAGIASASGISIQNVNNQGVSVPLAGSPETWMKADGTVSMVDGSTNPAPAELESSSHIADLAQADTSQGVSLTPFVASTSTALTDFGTEGVVTFVWSKNYNSHPVQEWSDITNVTLPQIDGILSAGYETTAFFTGKASESNNYVYLVGRNKGSGTRANVIADHSYGPTTKAVQQYSIGEGIEQMAVSTCTLDYEGDNGYESGGNVATAMSIDGSCQTQDPFSSHTNWMAIGYLGCSDALSITGSTNNFLTLDGVPENDGTIEEGQYYFWGHEHLYGRYQISGFQQTDGQKLFTAVTAQINNISQYGSVPSANDPAIGYKYMHAAKTSDVAYPSRLY